MAVTNALAYYHVSYGVEKFMVRLSLYSPRKKFLNIWKHFFQFPENGILVFYIKIRITLFNLSSIFQAFKNIESIHIFASGCSKVVEHSTINPEIESLNPATNRHSEEIREKIIFILLKWFKAFNFQSYKVFFLRH